MFCKLHVLEILKYFWRKPKQPKEVFYEKTCFLHRINDKINEVNILMKINITLLRQQQLSFGNEIHPLKTQLQWIFLVKNDTNKVKTENQSLSLWRRHWALQKAFDFHLGFHYGLTKFLFCSANQLTGFYMMTTPAFDELKTYIKHVRFPCLAFVNCLEYFFLK